MKCASNWALIYSLEITLVLDFHSSESGIMQRKTSIYICEHTHACAVESIVPAILTIIKYLRSVLQLQELEELNVFVMCWFFLMFQQRLMIQPLDRNNGLKAFSCSNPAAEHAASQRKKGEERNLRNYGARVLSSPRHKPHSLQGKDWLWPIRESQQVLREAMNRIQDSLQCLKDENIKKNYE